ncbi:acyloxyacyl hydrolase [Paenalcaligenes niemegkensis]|uniref:acyloxyacyl hydrolase n=1 Tax=Paenalcaligenes niemegkensis TaxID=2895469 RepID=UPI001EE91D10|nr:acyloxyacyl hydrolase [Paenalcaligenes niemegkensis]MCQ9616939.1 acyloxyacyl hydrolase [Paenalcaligenes niemegkensis]
MVYGPFGRPLNLQAEVGLAYWHAKRSSSSSSVWQLTATPMLRYWVSERWYLEAGIGPSVFSSVKFAGKRMGTAFQFADQVGVGVRITDNQRLSLRYSHYSNASIKKPNPGLDLLQLSYTFNF